jgi:hypothetical protein
MMQEKLHHNAEFHHVLSMLPPLHMHEGPWITGGSARRLWQGEDWHVGDVDVFFVNDQQRVSWLAEFDQVWNYTYRKRLPEPTPVKRYSFELGVDEPHPKHMPQASTILETDNAITFNLWYQLPTESEIRNCKLQVIKVRYAESLRALWDTFDFNVCCFAADAHKVYADPAAISDAETHEITHRNPQHSKNLPLRVFKHFSQGYHVSDELLKQAIRQIAEKDVDWCNKY